ncbi:hypothetical protein Patl1_02320 [Pistacia atlantica]|uniref:Uncharacterized protein n=1 Tax=Pistacia atlantica TaxID=434234 RepID=A0ACC1CB07_9ROSI|nr:hypothetical protein Patl1_02320 [Pistacia atlantica]
MHADELTAINWGRLLFLAMLLRLENVELLLRISSSFKPSKAGLINKLEQS